MLIHSATEVIDSETGQRVKVRRIDAVEVEVKSVAGQDRGIQICTDWMAGPTDDPTTRDAPRVMMSWERLTTAQANGSLRR